MAVELVTGDLGLEHKLKVAYGAWMRGDITSLSAMLCEDCEFTLVGDPMLNPQSGLRIGIVGLTEALEDFHRMFTVREFLLEKIVVSEADAFVHWHSALIIRANGRMVESERCDLIRFRDGLIFSIKCFYDSASMAIATGRTRLVPAPSGEVRPTSGRKAS